MGLSISTTPAKIAIETIPGGLSWNIRNARLDQKQKQALVNIKTEQPMILIDQYQCFAEEGLMNNFDLAKVQAQKGYSQVLKYTAKKAQDGDAMAKIGHKANIMINIAKNGAVTKHVFGMGSMPKSRPQIDVKGGTVDIEAEFRNHVGEINGVTSTYSAGDMNFNYTPTNVDIRMVSYGSVNIQYTGNNVDGYV